MESSREVARETSLPSSGMRKRQARYAGTPAPPIAVKTMKAMRMTVVSTPR
jgi:hypothetical protein